MMIGIGLGVREGVTVFVGEAVIVLVAGMSVSVTVGVGKATLGLLQETCIKINKKSINIFGGN